MLWPAPTTHLDTATSGITRSGAPVSDPAFMGRCRGRAGPEGGAPVVVSRWALSIPELSRHVGIAATGHDLFKNRRKAPSPRGNQAEAFFSPKSASCRRLLLLVYPSSA